MWQKMLWSTADKKEFNRFFYVSIAVHNQSPMANYERGEQKSSQVSEVSEQALLIFFSRLGGWAEE